MDIAAGFSEIAQVRFICQSPLGQEGFLDLCLSGTNNLSDAPLRLGLDGFFMRDDPRKTFGWSDEVWSAVEDGTVFLGMTRAQARASKGDPDAINTTTTASGVSEQWVYSDGYLYFENDKLTAIQSH